LTLGAEAPLGIRRPELIVKDVAPDVVESGLATYNSWRERREQGLAFGSQDSMTVQTVTQSAKAAGDRAPAQTTDAVEIVELPRPANRPGGRRFGALVHADLASAPLDGGPDIIRHLASVHGRILGATEEEIAAAADAVHAALTHPLMNQARDASRRGRCRREVPIVWRTPDGVLIEGVVDLAFERPDGWTVIDFKTDEEFRGSESAYRRQVEMYASAIQAATGARVLPVLMRV
jgi:ATP-dependent exoDNAse (exonuclease V) beta subunit